MVGDAKFARAAKPLAKLLVDKSPIVQYESAIALGKLGAEEHVDDVVDFAAFISSDDTALRHASAMALAGTASVAELTQMTKNSARTARIAAVLALRRKQSPSIAEFLDDADPYIAREAALAIHDVPIMDAFPQLAKAVTKSDQDEPFLRRALNANFRLGEVKNAAAVAQFAANSEQPDVLRNFALNLIDAWAEPSSRDAVLGQWRPIKKRSPRHRQTGSAGRAA